MLLFLFLCFSYLYWYKKNNYISTFGNYRLFLNLLFLLFLKNKLFVDMIFYSFIVSILHVNKIFKNVSCAKISFLLTHYSAGSKNSKISACLIIISQTMQN